MCEGRAKDKGAVPVRVPRKAVVRAGEGKVGRGMKWMGGEVIREVMEARPGREERIRPSRAEKVLGNLGVRKKAVSEVEVVGEVGVGGR